MLNVSVGDAPATLRAAVLAMKRADNSIKRDVSSRMRETMTPAWREEVSQNLTGWSMEGQMIGAGVRIGGGNPPQLIAAASRRRVGNGLIPDRHWAGYEYGANPSTTRKVRKRGGGTYTRHVMRHLPGKSKSGRVLGPAVASILPRVAAFWAQSVVRAFMDAADGKG